ncbi:hypothetical protein Vadar_013630 [Vaccinium darrowii]|uniref:Uncharacterized protein n=1 Tax=Vaccinium darrowii TaxID=229202 RepID=A0ACB7ZJS2_9ERIC|nr:hypothetical protein Vadar_013630 [Vaccinium darrowii]
MFVQIFRLEPRVGGLDLFVKEPSKEEEETEKTKYEKRKDEVKKSESLRRQEDPAAQEDLNKKIVRVSQGRGGEEEACLFVLNNINNLVKYSMEGFSSAKHHEIPSILSQKFSTLFGGSDKRSLRMRRGIF